MTEKEAPKLRYYDRMKKNAGNPHTTANTMNRRLGTSLYKADYCEQLIEHAGKGLSYIAFAGKIGVSVETLYNWEKSHPEFKTAKSIAQAAMHLYYEQIGLDHLVEEHQGPKLNTSSWKFQIQNKCGWADKTEISGNPDKPIHHSVHITTEVIQKMTPQEKQVFLDSGEMPERLKEVKE